MARSNATQGSFLGGEWSQSAQGRMDLPAYSTAMNASRNGYPTEEGAWSRRPGFLELGATYMGSPTSTNVEFSLVDGTLTYLEETFYSGNVYLRMWTSLAALFGAGYGSAPLALLPDDIVAVSAISTDDPAAVTVADATSWLTGDIVQIYPDQSTATSNAPQLAGRQLIITVGDTTHFTIADMVTGNAIDGSTLNFSGGNTYVAHIATIQTDYTSANDLTGSASLTGLRIVQTGHEAFFLSASYSPHILTLGPAITATAGQVIPFSFSFADAGFTSTSTNAWDGPYNDPLLGASQTGNSVGTLTNISGLSYTFDNTDSAYTFVANDVGRQMRFWTQPPVFDPSTSYNAGDFATYAGAYYQMSMSSTPAGTIPGQGYVDSGIVVYPWALNPQLGTWNIAVITAVAGSSATVLFNTTASVVNTTTDTWQLGAYYPGSWPTCGTFHEGRIWFGGLAAGRFDASITGALTVSTPPFQPTDYFGEVTDANAITYTLNTPPQSDLVWMMTDTLGVVCGTEIDEWLVSAPNTSGSISPTNIQGRRMTRYGSAAIEPIRAGTSIIFVQAQQRQLIEYTVAPFASTTPVGWHLNTMAKHLTADGQTPRGIIGVTYQEEPTPILWVTRADSTLIGCTYRRQSTFGNEPPTFYGWHRHDYGYAPEDPGLGRNVAMGGGATGTGAGSGGPVVSTADPNTGVGYVEIVLPAFSENTPIAAGASLDGSPGGYLSGVDTTPFGEIIYYTDTSLVDKSAGTYTPSGGDIVFTSLGAGVSVSGGSLVLPPGGYNVGCGGSVVQQSGSGGTMSATVTGSTGSTTGTLTFGTDQTSPFGTGFDCVITETTTFYITLVFSVDVQIFGDGIIFSATPVG